MNDSPQQPPEASPTEHDTTPPDERADVDLDRIETDLAGVEAALQRLDAGTYWIDEVTGDPIPDDVLVVDPVARRSQ